MAKYKVGTDSNPPPPPRLHFPERKLGQMTIIHTPWSAVIHAGLAILGYSYHRNFLHTAGVPGLHPLAVGPGLVGLVEPCVSVCFFFFRGGLWSWWCCSGVLTKDALGEIGGGGEALGVDKRANS